MSRLEGYLDGMRQEHTPWLDFGRFLVTQKIEALRAQYSAQPVQVISGRLELPREMQSDAKGLLSHALFDGSEDMLQICFAKEPFLSILSLNPYANINIDPRDNTRYLLDLTRYGQSYMKDATEFGRFKAACGIIDCLADNFQVVVEVNSVAT